MLAVCSIANVNISRVMEIEIKHRDDGNQNIEQRFLLQTKTILNKSMSTEYLDFSIWATQQHNSILATQAVNKVPFFVQFNLSY